MNGLTRYIVNAAQAKTGLSNAVFIGYLVQAALGLCTAVLFLVAIFFIFSDSFGFGGTATSTGMFLTFVFLLCGSIVWTNRTKRQIKIDAERALRVRSAAVMLDPPLLKFVMQLGRAVGWRRFVPVAVAMLAVTGAAAEWNRRRSHTDPQH